MTDADDSLLYRYTYDDLGQLIREDNVPLFKTFTYSYDDAGNLTNKIPYDFTTTSSLGTTRGYGLYTYSGSSWGDLLTHFSASTTEDEIAYDEIGNPIKIGYFTDDEEYFDYGDVDWLW